MVLARALLGGFDVWMLEPTSNPIPETSPLLEHRKWFISLVPMQLEAFRNDNLQKESVNWKGLLLGGTAITSSQTELIKWVRCPVYQSYGMTETVSHIAVRPIPPVFANEIPYSVLPGIEIKTDENQCLAIRGRVTDFEWLQTNDRVEVLNATQFLYLGRADDVINSGGLKFDPNQLKTMYIQAVDWKEEEFEIVGLSDDILGQKVVLAFRKSPDKEWIDPSRFHMDIQKLSHTVESFRMPKAIYLIEHFPLTPTFKLDRPSLSQQLAHLHPVWEKSVTGLSKKNG